MPIHTETSSCGTPCSAKVGADGNSGERFFDVTASAFKRLVDVYGCAEAVVVNIVWTCAPSMSSQSERFARRDAGTRKTDEFL